MQSADPALPARVVITIDGPAGTGKSTVARGLAARIGCEFLDTGAMYRAAALIAIERNIDPSEGDTLARAVETAAMRFDWTCDPPCLMLGGRPVNDLIRGEDVNTVVSLVAARREVREVLVRRQQRIAEEHPRLVTEGRDQGSVVFPDAPVRFYLDADVRVRAQRRMAQMASSGQPAVEDVMSGIRRRDELDTSRPDSPLVCPEGAIVVDTSHYSLDETIDHLERETRRLLPGLPRGAR